jgi:hypothetical protein
VERLVELCLGDGIRDDATYELFLLASKDPAASRRAIPPSMITAWPCSFRKEKRHLAVLNRQADPSVRVRSVVGKPGVGRLTGTVQSAVRGGHGRVLQNHTPLPDGSPLPRQAVMTEPGQNGDSLSRGRTRVDGRAVRPKGRPAGDQGTGDDARHGRAERPGAAVLPAVRLPHRVGGVRERDRGFQVTLEKQYFPYPVHGAHVLTIDVLTLYAEGNGSIAPISPINNAGVAALTTGLSGAEGAATLTLPCDSTVMTGDQTHQVFLVLQYHFGTA